MGYHELGVGSEFNIVEKIAKEDAFPGGIEFAPARNTMNVRCDLGPGHSSDILKREGFFFLNQPKNSQIPLREV
jgi:hypothetical protein